MKHTRESLIALIDECRKNGTHINLRGSYLSGLDLRGIYLRGADLQESDMRGTNLQGADLQGANMRGANLRWSDLRWAQMQWADLQGADLQGSKLDFAGYELSCKTIGIKVDKRLVSQLLYHLCKMDVVNCPEWDELRNDGRIIDLANKSHVIDDYDLPEIEPLNTQEDE